MLAVLKVKNWMIRFLLLCSAILGSISLMAQDSVVLFYSSMGMGHLSAARSIGDDIRRKDPQIKIILKDIRDFETPLLGSRKLQHYTGEKSYWYVVKNHPDLFTRLYRNKMDNEIGRAHV